MSNDLRLVIEANDITHVKYDLRGGSVSIELPIPDEWPATQTLAEKSTREVLREIADEVNRKIIDDLDPPLKMGEARRIFQHLIGVGVEAGGDEGEDESSESTSRSIKKN
jgi:hypothetical protein